jgi:hypothetical protein
MNSIEVDSRKNYKIEGLTAVQEGNFFLVLPLFVATNIPKLFKIFRFEQVKKHFVLKH